MDDTGCDKHERAQAGDPNQRKTSIPDRNTDPDAFDAWLKRPPTQDEINAAQQFYDSLPIKR